MVLMRLGARGEPADTACWATECPSCGGPTLGGTPQSRAGSGLAKVATGKHRISAPKNQSIQNRRKTSLFYGLTILEELNAALHAINVYRLVFLYFIL